MPPPRDPTPDPGDERLFGWTVDTLHSHLQGMMDERDRRYAERFDAQQKALGDALAGAEKAVAAALTAADRAVAKAEMASEKRFEGVNEFRQTLSDQASNLMPRAEAEARMRALFDKLEAQQKILDQQLGNRAGTKDSWGYLVGFVGLIATIGGIVGLVVGLSR